MTYIVPSCAVLVALGMSLAHCCSFVGGVSRSPLRREREGGRGERERDAASLSCRSQLQPLGLVSCMIGVLCRSYISKLDIYKHIIAAVARPHTIVQSRPRLHTLDIISQKARGMGLGASDRIARTQ